MRTPPRLTTLRSFTLIELLVVMGIMAILVAVSFAGITSAIRAAHFAASTSNLRQIGHGIIDYAGDNDSVVPTWYNYSQNQYWWQTIAPYVGIDGTNYNTGIYRDPGDPAYVGTSYDTISTTLSYGYNYLVMGRSDSDGDAKHLAALSASTVAVTDAPNTNSYGYIDPYDHYPDTNRYSGFTPALFVDGHVERMSVTNFETETPYFVPSP